MILKQISKGDNHYLKKTAAILRAILVSDWLLFKKIFSSETAWQNGPKHLCKILYKASSFGSIRPTNMATKINYLNWILRLISKLQGM
jgi:hypothetical protein